MLNLCCNKSDMPGRSGCSRSIHMAVLAIGMCMAAGQAQAANTGPATDAVASGSESDQFCLSVRDIALERRYALKQQQLNALKARIEKRIVLLEEKKEQFQNWAKKREEFISRADATLVAIYSKMRPDAAAVRLEAVGEGLAASIIMKLSSRQAGVILNEMKPERAAAITQIIAAFGQKGDAS